MSYFLYRRLYNQFFLNPEGIKPFAQRCITRYISQAAVQQANILTTYLTVLTEERNKKRTEFIEAEASDRMDDGSFTLRRKRAKRLKIVVYVTVLFEIFLNYISTLIFIQGEGLLFILVRWGLSIILTLSAMLVTDGLLTKLLPEDSVRVKGKSAGNEEDENFQRSAKLKRIIALILLPILLVALEIAIIGVAGERARDMEGGQTGSLLAKGFILLSMALPLIAGYFKWEAEQHGKLYQNTLSYHKTRKLLHTMDLIVVANRKDMKNVVESSIRKAWQVFSKFRLYKENYNLKNDILKEDLSRHYVASPETFRAEALNQFGTEVKNILREQETTPK